MALEDFSVAAFLRGAYDLSGTFHPSKGFEAGLPNFHSAPHADGVLRYGVHFLGGPGVTWRDVPASELGAPDDDDDIGAHFRAAHDWAHERRLGSAFPNLHRFDHGDGRGPVHGLVLLDGELAQRLDVPGSHLGIAHDADARARFRAMHDYAVANGYLTGFPNFHQFDYRDGRGMVHGTVLVRRGQGEWMDVRHEAMRAAAAFVQPSDRALALELLTAHRTLLEDVETCAELSVEARAGFLAAYDREVRHEVDPEADGLLATTTGGSVIRVGLTGWNAVSRPFRKAAMAHMMMHLAGRGAHPNQYDQAYKASDAYVVQACSMPSGLLCQGSGGSWRIARRNV